MTNIEKLLNAMVNFNAEKLILKIGQPPVIIREGKDVQVSKNSLGISEIQHLENEFVSVFGQTDIFRLNEKNIVTEKKEDGRVFFPEQKKSVQVTQPSSPDSFSILNILRKMIEDGASDLHLSANCKPYMRIDGDIVLLEQYPELTEDVLWPELKSIAPDNNIEEFETRNDTDFAYEIKGLARFRSNYFRDNKGICAVFRQIPSDILSAETLGIPKAVLKLCDIPKGLILVTGPTGSGKSTTLAGMIDHVNSTKKSHIITIEDPVEFVHPNKLSLVNQREIGTHTESFSKALRAALREDPDIILVGEMRDLETIAIAIEMAVTGHLVFGTLHTSTAVGTVDRIVDQFPSDQQSQIKVMLADALIGVVSQVLCRKKEKGRVAALEVLIVTPPVSNLIRESKNFQIPSLMQTGKGLGMQLMNDSLFDLVAKNIVDKEEAIAKSIDKEELIRKLKTKGLM